MEDSSGARSARRDCVVVMGPSGVGKTTIAELLSRRLGWSFAEADEFHPQANIDKMTAGVPLTDEDRAPWLVLIRDWISAEARDGRCSVVTCSALKRRYRDVLRDAGARVRFLELAGNPEMVAGRLAGRKGHYMPPSLLGSQFATLEPLAPDEDGARISVVAGPEAVADQALAALGLAAALRSARGGAL